MSLVGYTRELEGKREELEGLELIKPKFINIDNFNINKFEQDGEYGELYCEWVKYNREKELYSNWLSKKIKLQNDVCFIKKKMNMEKFKLFTELTELTELTEFTEFTELKIDPLIIDTSSEIELGILKWYEGIPVQDRSNLLKKIIIKGLKNI